jgi:hypothetical protein
MTGAKEVQTFTAWIDAVAGDAEIAAQALASPGYNVKVSLGFDASVALNAIAVVTVGDMPVIIH